MPSKKKKQEQPEIIDYMVATAYVEHDEATCLARRMLEHGYKPWSIPLLSHDQYQQRVRWTQTFIKRKEVEDGNKADQH